MPKSALDLARALKRYTRMRPENAYVALAKEWPIEIAGIVSDVLWSEVKGRPAKEITREIVDLMRKAEEAHARSRRRSDVRSRARSEDDARYRRLMRYAVR